MAISKVSIHQHTAFALRLTLGFILLSHGFMKVLSFGVDGTVGYFASLGLPAAAAYLTMFGEIAGGVAVLLGVYTRLAAALALPILLGACWVHSGNGWVFSNAGGGWEYPLLLVVLALLVAVQGAGSFALGRARALNVLRPVPVFA